MFVFFIQKSIKNHYKYKQIQFLADYFKLSAKINQLMVEVIIKDLNG